MSGLGSPWFNLYPQGVPRLLEEPERSVIDLFEAMAQRLPDAPAVMFFDRVLTFGQLNAWAERWAAQLAQWGIGLGDRIGILMQNDPQFLVAQYGAWKRGAVVVPFNPMLKERELEYQLADAGVRVLVCLESLCSDFVLRASGQAGVERIVIAGDADVEGGAGCAEAGDPVCRAPAGPDAGSAGPGGAAGREGLDLSGAGLPVTHLRDVLRHGAADPGARAPVGPDDVAYLIYTSGTTGLPKGAMNTHRNVAFNANVYRVWMNITSSDTILGLAPIFHVTGIVGHVALSACTGAPLILFHRFHPATALDMIRRWRPTMTVGSITAYIALLNHPDCRREDFVSLTKCYSGGAPIPAGVVAEAEERLGIYIHNIYGLTETNSPTHAVPLGARAPVDADSGAFSIGVPVPNCDARVVSLDDPSRPLPVGELGELAVRGPMIFSGYWNKAEETRRAFCDGYFLTGDVVRQDEDGWFYVVDRKKDVIIASGFKVWPREVEDVLYQHPGVKEAAVVGVPDAYRGETVKAYVSLKDTHSGRVTPDELIAFCRERMAAYKYPRRVDIVPEIPKTASGKILRRLLREG
ncbi:MAG: long-chain fatty acid--CoA ligase [Alicyclobacillus sp.]|nr:long-chain fatty acid--CoA ligase [Alicyclobacillus sp.]